MDKISAAIRERTIRLAEAERAVDSIRAELQTLLTAAKLAGIIAEQIVAEVAEASPRQSGRGKPPGTISQKWRDILTTLADAGGAFTLADVKVAAELHGAGSETGSIRDRVRKLCEHGFVCRKPDGTYTVSDIAIVRFNLPIKKQPAPPGEEDAV